jgi:hypothetical protein
MIEIVESKLKFNFETEHWSNVINFDKHADYINVEKCIKGTKIECENVKFRINGTQGIDILGIFEKNTLFFFEVKNFKNHRIANKEKFENSADLLTTDIARKVRDSIACIVAGNRNSTHAKELWKRVLDILANHKKDIFVIFWMEEDCITPEKEKIKLFNYQKTLQQKLKWLTNTNNIRIYSKLNYPKDFHFNTEFV